MSKHFECLKKRIDEIENGLGLVKPVTDETNLNDYQELTKAYILLCHAELEKYFEMIGIQIIKDSQEKYLSTKIVNEPLLSAATTCEYKFTKPADFAHNNDLTISTLDARVKKTCERYYASAKSNNGIKNKDIFNLMWPLGFTETELGSTLLNLLENLGSSRGRIAHTGMTINKTILNYSQEKNKIKNIIIELAQFDSLIDSNNYLQANTTITDIENILFN